jgi:hypothetical protein
MFYHDGRHPLIYMYEPPMQKEEYEAAVNELVGTPVEAIMFCLGDGRTVLHDTQVGELWGDPNDKWQHIIFRRAHQNAKHLIDEGKDPLRVVCDRAHALGLLFYPTLLVNQGSGERGVDMRSSNFRFDNKQWDIGSKGGVDPNSPAFKCADFMHQEIRDERFALIQETLHKYPVDGFELQLDYGPHYFHPTEIEAGRPVMTDWIRRVHEAVKSSGGSRELVIRIPAQPNDCLAIGLDPQEWIDQEIVDVLVGETFPGTEQVEQMEDFTTLVSAAKNSKTRVHAAIHSQVHSERIAEATIEMVRATACNYWDQGIDGLYIAYWFSNWPYDGTFYEKLREMAHPEVMEAKDKYYFVRTRAPNDPPGTKTPLPVDLHEGASASAIIKVTDDLPRWGEAGRVHQVLLRLRLTEATELDRLRFRLNGKDLPESRLRKINEMFRMCAPRYLLIDNYWYVFDLDKEYWPVRGLTKVEVVLESRDPDVVPGLQLRDVELEIKYLMGKNFHRGFIDPDLGPYEYSMP